MKYFNIYILAIFILFSACKKDLPQKPYDKWVGKMRLVAYEYWYNYQPWGGSPFNSGGSIYYKNGKFYQYYYVNDWDTTCSCIKKKSGTTIVNLSYEIFTALNDNDSFMIFEKYHNLDLNNKIISSTNFNSGFKLFINQNQYDRYQFNKYSWTLKGDSIEYNYSSPYTGSSGGKQYNWHRVFKKM